MNIDTHVKERLVRVCITVSIIATIVFVFLCNLLLVFGT